LFAQKDLNPTVSENATDWSNSILQSELMIPNKKDALAYIDGDAKPPTRYAHVVLDLRATDKPTYTDILVGPLPVNNVTTTWQGLEYPYTRNTRGSIRSLDVDETALCEWLYSVSATVSDITLDLWNGTALGLKNDTLDIWCK
jgi:primary-amine oxidase